MVTDLLGVPGTLYLTPVQVVWCRRNQTLDNGRPQAGVAIAGEVADILRRDEDLITRLTDCRRTSCQDDVGVECIGRSGR